MSKESRELIEYYLTLRFEAACRKAQEAKTKEGREMWQDEAKRFEMKLEELKSYPPP